jgi:polyhydroxybutyrate depolymerase
MNVRFLTVGALALGLLGACSPDEENQGPSDAASLTGATDAGGSPPGSGTAPTFTTDAAAAIPRYDAATPLAPSDASTAPSTALVPIDAGPGAPSVVPAVDGSVPGDAGPSAQPVSCPSTSGLKPGKSTFTLMRDGTQRKVTVYVPRNYDGKKPLPLIVDFHPLLTSVEAYEGISTWDDTVDSNQFIVAMPQGIQNSWNIGPCCTESRKVDDVGYAREVVKKLVADGCIDTKRIYATGYSNGGGMSHKLACDAADVFAAVAPSAFDLVEEMTCKPSRPISVFMKRGTNDPIVPYSGGASTPPTLYLLDPIHFLGAQGTFKRWAELNQCTDTPVDTGGNCKTYSKCAAGVKVTLCTADGGGHDANDVKIMWPMLKDYMLP